MFLKHAQDKVPFQILTPEYLPEGYEAQEYNGDQYAMLVESQQKKKRGEAPVSMVRGVILTYRDVNLLPGSSGHPILIEQTLGQKGDSIVGPAERVRWNPLFGQN